jgi:hypothetical protein
MPITIDRTRSLPQQSENAQDLARVAEAFRATSADVKSTAGTLEFNESLRSSLSHLQNACDSLAAWACATAVATTETSGAGPVTSPQPASRATAWHLHHLGSTLRASRDACHMAAAAAEDLEPFASDEAGR